MARVTMGVYKYRVDGERSTTDKIGEIEIDMDGHDIINPKAVFNAMKPFAPEGWSFHISHNDVQAFGEVEPGGALWQLRIFDCDPIEHYSGGGMNSYEQADEMEKQHLELHGGSHDGE